MTGDPIYDQLFNNDTKKNWFGLFWKQQTKNWLRFFTWCLDYFQRRQKINNFLPFEGPEENKYKTRE